MTSQKRIFAVGPQSPNPAFQAILSILNSILSENQLSVVLQTDCMTKIPILLKPIVFLFQELKLVLSLLKNRARNSLSAIFIFQTGY